MNKVKLSEIATVELSSIDKKIAQNEIPVKLCNFTDVYYNWAITEDIISSCMKGSVKETELNKFTLKKGQVAITKDSETRDDIGMPCYISDSFDNAVLGYHCALITPNNNKLNGKYLNALLNTEYARKCFENQASGSGQRYTLSKEAIESIQIPLPSLDGQKRIGSFFSNIDKKIQNNKKQIETLESIAKTIYDYWFVQFDFPNEDGKPYKSSGGKMVWNEELKREIPEGWNETCIEKITNCLDSKRIPLSGKQRELKKGNIPYYGATSIMGFIDEFIFDGDYVLMAEDGSIMTPLNTPILQRISGKTWVNNHAHVIEPIGKYSCSIIFHFLKNVYVPSLKTGSIQAKITQNKMNSIKVVNIPDALLEKYNETIEPIDKKIKISSEEISNLNKVKRYLLPLIMNGQASLK